MPKKVVFVGTPTPLLKIFFQLCGPNEFENLKFPGVFTELTRSRQMDRCLAKIGMALFDVGAFRSAAGLDLLLKLEPDWLFSIVSPIIFRNDILQIPKDGALNLHPGRLPDYAGQHAHQWAIRNGENHFGVSLHWIEAKVDAGPIVASVNFTIAPNDTGLSLYMKCLAHGVPLVIEALQKINSGQPLDKIPQDLSKRREYLHKESLDGNIDWNWTAEKICLFVRAADYGLFKGSPYTPTFQVRAFKFELRTCTLGASTDTPPGTVLEISDSCFLVATGAGTSLRIYKTLSMGGGPRLDDYVRSVGMSVGSLLS
jgi:methionyl-tRNA formyltransferase